MKFAHFARWAGRLTLAVGLLSGGVALAQNGPATPAAPTSVLYNQTTNVSTSVWASSSNFETSLNNFDSQAADDFVISHAEWTVSSISVPGLYDGPAGTTYVNSLLVQFYSDAGSTPAKPASSPLASRTIPAGSIGGLSTGQFSFALNPVVILGPGHYWLSVQANKSFGADGRQWGWREYKDTTALNSESVWQQPGNGYQKNCLTWKPRVSVCHEPATSSEGKDLAFELQGTSFPVNHQIFAPIVHR